MATESTSRAPGARLQATERESATERDADNLAQQVETLKADLAAITATLADLVKDSAREGRATIEKTADHYVREARRQADTAVEGRGLTARRWRGRSRAIPSRPSSSLWGSASWSV